MAEPTQEETMLPARKDDVILPLRSGAQMGEAIRAYKELQTALDQSLEDCIMPIGGKKFRKKNYWRAVATAFGLNVEEIKEERIHSENGEDWGWLVTYKATAPNGKFATGDGSCTASEKAEGQDTVHNVRSHAHTRGFNRAVSNLVGFGEVSAEELRYDKDGNLMTGERDAGPYVSSHRAPYSGRDPEGVRKELKDTIEKFVLNENLPADRTFEEACADLLKAYSSYKTFPGASKVTDLTEAQARITLEKFKRDHR